MFLLVMQFIQLGQYSQHTLNSQMSLIFLNSQLECHFRLYRAIHHSNNWWKGMWLSLVSPTIYQGWQSAYLSVNCVNFLANMRYSAHEDIKQQTDWSQS